MGLILPGQHERDEFTFSISKAVELKINSPRSGICHLPRTHQSCQGTRTVPRLSERRIADSLARIIHNPLTITLLSP